MSVLGRYELVRALGEHERVWEAELVGPAGFRKRVAIRRLPEHAPEVLDAARSAGMLHHPNLVEVYEVDRADGGWYCAMEFVRGGQLIERAPLPPRAVVDAGLQVCAGLAVRQASPVPRRVLDPREVLVDEGVVKLGVVGSGRALDPIWRPPEGDLDARSDVWSVGALLHLLATGGREASLESAGLLADVLLACLAERPEDRFQSLDDVAAALDAVEAVGPGLVDLSAGGAPVDVGHWSAGPRTNIDDVGLLVGRATLLRELAGRLANGRLLTLKGPPGVGKSHLARALARQRLAAGTAEAWWVRPGAGDLARSVSSELGLLADDATGTGLALADRGDLVLLVDPIEGHLDEAGTLASWLGVAPGLRIVVPSMEPLRVPGEQIVEVGPIDQEAAGALLAEIGGLPPGEADERLAAADGLPRALLDPDGLQQGLDELARRLAPWERAALKQLCAVDGVFTLDEAEDVVDVEDDPDAPWSLDVIAALVDRSLVSPAPGAGPPRFRILGPIRRWARTL